MKRRLLKKVVKATGHATPARFRANDQVKREWVRIFEAKMPKTMRIFGTIHYDYDRAGNPVKCGFGQWVFCSEFRPWWRIIARTEGEGFFVSTIFTGLDRAWMTDSPRPLVFETAVFEGETLKMQELYNNRKDALAGHAGLVASCQAMEASHG